MTNVEGEVIRKLRDVIEKGGNIDVNTRDILLFSAIIEINNQLEQLKPLLTFYKTVMWGLTILGALIIELIFKRGVHIP